LKIAIGIATTIFFKGDDFHRGMSVFLGITSRLLLEDNFRPVQHFLA
jgi:hypothetical protein